METIKINGTEINCGTSEEINLFHDSVVAWGQEQDRTDELFDALVRSEYLNVVYSAHLNSGSACDWEGNPLAS